MGRLDIGYVLSILKRNVLKYLPKQIRKPLLLICSLMGLYFYYKMMFRLSVSLFDIPSRYLVILGNIITSIKDMFITVDPRLLIIVIIAGGYLFISKYLLSNENNKYSEINGLISIGYTVITIATFLPFILK